jgi:hypothetical protein
MSYGKLAICILVLLLASCDRMTPRQKAAQEARDVAQVEAVQAVHPPMRPIRPQPISPNVRKVYRLATAGCEFVIGPRPGADPVFVADKAKAVMLLDGEPAVLAADSGSADLGSGVRERYVGRAQSARLTRAPDSLTLRDRFRRIVFQAAGTLRCHD